MRWYCCAVRSHGVRDQAILANEDVQGFSIMCRISFYPSLLQLGTDWPSDSNGFDAESRRTSGF
jgi:hypothetical protein